MHMIDRFGVHSKRSSDVVKEKNGLMFLENERQKGRKKFTRGWKDMETSFMGTGEKLLRYM